MKCPIGVNGQSWENIPELINHLWTLYSDMTLDPALTEPAEHVRTAALELEKVRRAAYEVYKEERAAFEAAIDLEVQKRTMPAEPGPNGEEQLPQLRLPPHLKQ